MTTTEPLENIVPTPMPDAKLEGREGSQSRGTGAVGAAEQTTEQRERWESMEELSKYYREFHHKCVTWYITIFGFFLAGVIAAPESSSIGRIYLLPVLVYAVFLFFWFGHFMLLIAARVSFLQPYLDSPSLQIPASWRALQRKVRPGHHGVGEVFFLGILLAMPCTLGMVAFLKYWRA